MKFVQLALVAQTLCVSILFAHYSGAEARQLTLEQTLSIAAEKNRDIEKAREYARYVQGKYLEERAAALPQLSFNGSAYLGKDESQAASLGVAPRQYSRTLDLSISQPLYTWGKVNAAIRAAEVGLKTADEQLRLYRQQAHRDAVTAFYDILLARELRNQASESLDQRKRHLDEAQRKLASGVATDYDVLAAEVAVENARPDLIRAEHVVRTALDRLSFLLALDDADTDVSGTLEAAIEQPLPYHEALSIAAKKRPELADLRLRIGIYSELVTIADADNKPRLDLKGSVGWHWLNLNGMTTPAAENGAAWNIGVFLSYPFFDGFKTSGRVLQAKSDLRTKQIEESKLLDAIALEIREAGNAAREAVEIVQAIAGTVRQAERLLQMAEKGYEFGVKNRLEVDDARSNLLLARSNLARARRDYLVTQTTYAWTMGVAGEALPSTK